MMETRKSREETWMWFTFSFGRGGGGGSWECRVTMRHVTDVTLEHTGLASLSKYFPPLLIQMMGKQYTIHTCCALVLVFRPINCGKGDLCLLCPNQIIKTDQKKKSSPKPVTLQFLDFSFEYCGWMGKILFGKILAHVSSFFKMPLVPVVSKRPWVFFGHPIL